MIKSFVHKGLTDFFYTGNCRGIRPEQARRLRRILDRLHAAAAPSDMNGPGLFLHRLKGERKREFSVRVSANWRLVFVFEGGDAYGVGYEDYH